MPRVDSLAIIRPLSRYYAGRRTHSVVEWARRRRIGELPERIWRNLVGAAAAFELKTE
jgi:hypothetical protein